MAFTSTIQILKINPVASGVSVKTGKPWERHTAEAMLLNDDGSIEVVGKLNIPKDLRGSIKEGIYRASFSFYVPGMGDSKGEISTTLVGLMAVPPNTVRSPISAPSASATARTAATPASTAA